MKKGVRPEPGSSETPVVKAGVSDSLDVHVGQQLRRRRLALKIRLKKFSKDAGVSQKQIQRFESGENRTIARRLFDFARLLNVSPEYFFEDMESLREKALTGALRMRRLRLPWGMPLGSLWHSCARSKKWSPSLFARTSSA